MAESPQLPRALATAERQRNAMDAFPSLKYRSSHKLSHDFVEDSCDKRKSLPSTFQQVYPSNRDSNSSYGYVPYHPAPSVTNDCVGPHYEVLHNPIYCNLPFQELSPAFVPLTPQNMLAGDSQDSLDHTRDTFVTPKPPSRHNQSFPTTPETDTFQPVRFITMEEEKRHASQRSLATPVSTRLFITTPVDPDMVSLSASQDCVYDSDRNTQKKCIRMLSQSMNLNPDITSWVIPPVRAKRYSLASVDRSSVDQSEESLEWQGEREEEIAPRKEKVLGKIIHGIVGFFKTRPKRRISQSDRRADKRKSKIGVIEHLTHSGASSPRELSPLCHPGVSFQPQSMPHSVPQSDTPLRRQTPLFRELSSLPNSDRKMSNVSNVSRDTITANFDRKSSTQSNVSQNHATSKPTRHIKPTTLPLQRDDVYENLPFQKSATKPPLPHSNSIYSNIEEMARTCSDTLPPIASRTPEPIKQRSISDTKNRTGFPDGIPYAGLRKAVAKEQSVTKERRNVKNFVRNLGSTPNIVSPTKTPDHFTSTPLSHAEVSTGPTHRKASAPTTSPPHDHLTPLNRFNSVETLC